MVLEAVRVPARTVREHVRDVIVPRLRELAAELRVALRRARPPAEAGGRRFVSVPLNDYASLCTSSTDAGAIRATPRLTLE